MRAIAFGSRPLTRCTVYAQASTGWHSTSNRCCCCHATAQGAAQLTSQDSPGAQQAPIHKQYPRFYAPHLPAAAGMSIELEPEEARHAVRVLRLQPGDTVELCDARGGLVQCEVAATSKTSAMLMATAEPSYQPWQGPKWVVAAACLTLKGGRTDWLVEKATELGAHSLLPLITARSQTGTTKDKFKALAHKAGQPKKRQRPAGDSGGSSEGSSDFQPSRLGRLAVAATKQSLRTHGLQVQPTVSLEQLLPELQAAPVSCVAMAGAPPVLQVLQTQWQQQQQQQQHHHHHQTAQQQQQQPASSQGLPASPAQPGAGHQAGQQVPGNTHPWHDRLCYMLIGPEGDFTPDEVSLLSAAGVLPVGLGPHRLRTETAAIAALSAAVLLTDSHAAMAVARSHVTNHH